MVQRSLTYLVLAGLMSCKGDPTGDLRNGADHLLASPSAIFLNAGASKFVVVTAVDEQGNAVTAKFSDGTAGTGVTITRDLTYLPVYDKDGNLVTPSEVTSARYTVTANAATANSSVTISAGGQQITVPVRIIPTTTVGLVTSSTAAPGNGDTTNLTLAAPYKFSGTSVASIGGTALFKAGLSADSSVMRVVAGPGLKGVVSVTNVVLGYAPTQASFTTGSTDTVTTPALPVMTANKTTAAFVGDTITVTAPAKFRFLGNSAVTVGTTPVLRLSLSADSTQLRFLIGNNANAKVSINNLTVIGARTLGPFTDTTAVAVTSPALPVLTSNVTTAAAGDTIVVTAPANFGFTPGASGSVPTVGAAGLASLGVSADSSQIRFLIGPSANAKISVTRMFRRGAPTLGPFTDTTAAALTTPAIPNFAGVFSSATPAINDTVTMTVPSNFRLLPTATVTLAGQRALVVSRAADSLSLKFVPSPGGAAGPVTVNGIVLSFLRTVSLNLPSSTNVTPPAIGAGLAGTGDFATAPTITLPASGQSKTFFDFGAFANFATCLNDAGLGGPCRIYKLVLAAPTTFTFTTAWQGTTDLGMYFFNSAFVRQSGPCDALGNGAGGQPETCTGKTLAAGTWYIVVDDFGPFYTPAEASPTWIRFTFNVN